MVGVELPGSHSDRIAVSGWVRISLLVLTVFILFLLTLMWVSERTSDGLHSATESNGLPNQVEAVSGPLRDANEDTTAAASSVPRSSPIAFEAATNADRLPSPSLDRFPSEPRPTRPERADSSSGDRRNSDSDKDKTLESIGGTVFDESGDVVAGIQVSLIALDTQTNSQSGRSARSDRLGMFRFDRLDPGEYEVRALGGERYHSLSQRVRAGVGSLEIHLQSKGEFIVAGRVTDESGQPIADSRVRALGGRVETRSAQDGSYRTVVERRQASQAPVLVFSHPQFREHRAALVGSSAQGQSSVLQLDVTLKARTSTVRLEGLVSGPFNEEVSGVTVWLNSSRPGSFRRTVTDSFGIYAFERVESNGSYQIGVDGNRDYAPSDPRWISIGSHDKILDLRLRRRSAGELHGTLVNPEGSVLPSFTVRVKSSGAVDRYPLDLTSDAFGGFWIREIEAGDLLFMTTSLPRLEARGAVLEAGTNRYVEVVLDWGEYWLFGRVVDARGRPVPGARVTAQWGMQFGDVFSQSQRETRTDLEGHFAFSNLAARDYTLTVRAEGHPHARVFHSLVGGTDREVLITLAGVEP